MIESLIAAERECTEQEDVNPAKVLRPISTTFKEWNECLSSTELPHWVYWRVKGYMETFRGRRGKTLLYERMEEIEQTREGRMSNWYEENIEPGIRRVVKLLRRNGVNTECSCEHGKYVQCQYPMDEGIKNVDYLLFNNGFRNYKIDIHITREDGHARKGMNIEFEELTEQTYEKVE